MENTRRLSAGRLLTTFLIHVVLIIFSVLIIYPLLYVIGSAFSPSNNLQGIGINPFAQNPTFAQFIRLFETTNYKLWYTNTLTIAVMVSLATLIITSTSAYIFSRFKFMLRKQMMIAFLVFQIFPSFVGMVAIYVLLLRIGGLDTKWGLALVYIAGNLPYNTWLVKSYMDSIPKSFDEAARIDGASIVQQFFRLTVPLLKPIILLTTILSTNGTLQLFDEVKTMTNSGPGNATMTLSTYIYRLTFENVPTFGYAAAIAFTIFVMVALLSTIQRKVGASK